MQRNGIIVGILILVSFITYNQACFAETTPQENYNIVDFKLPTPQPAIKPDNNVNSNFYKINSSNAKFEDAIQNLESARIEIEKDYNEIKNQLDEAKRKVKQEKEEKNKLNRKFKIIKKEIKTLDAAKKKIRKNIQLREKLYNPLNPFTDRNY